jgi:hypothetical protein
MFVIGVAHRKSNRGANAFSAENRGFAVWRAARARWVSRRWSAASNARAEARVSEAALREASRVFQRG